MKSLIYPYFMDPFEQWIEMVLSHPREMPEIDPKKIGRAKF